MQIDPYLATYKVENLINWIVGKDPDEKYNYYSCKNCLLAQYFRYHIPEFASIGVDWWDKEGKVYEIPNFKELNSIAYGYGTSTWTYGEALERARAYLDNQERQTNQSM